MTYSVAVCLLKYVPKTLSSFIFKAHLLLVTIICFSAVILIFVCVQGVHTMKVCSFDGPFLSLS